MAAPLLYGADKFRYDGLKSTLAQHMSTGTNQYTRSLEEMMNILNICMKTSRGQQKGKEN